MFGDVDSVGVLALNDAGRMIARWWEELANKFPHVIPDASIVMPNHFHGVIAIVPIVTDTVGADLRVGPVLGNPILGSATRDNTNRDAHIGAPLPIIPKSTMPGPVVAAPMAGLPEIMQWFKTMTTNEYMRGVKTLGWRAFPGKLWQRSYYEHIIRDDTALARIRRYIHENPLRWALDRENPTLLGNSENR